jgi:ABC-type multidrug transport system ATPase subunit
LSVTDPPATPALELRHLRVKRGGLTVIDGLSVVLPAGTATGLVGTNGAGKTTLVEALAGLIPSSGEIHLDGKPVIRRAESLSERESRSSSIGSRRSRLAATSRQGN